MSPKAATGVGVLRRALTVGLVALSALVFAVPSEAQNTAPTGKPTIDGTPGLDFLSGSCIEPGDDLEIAKTEGWIWVKDPR